MRKDRDVVIKITLHNTEPRWSGSIFDPKSKIMTVGYVSVEWGKRKFRGGAIITGENLPPKKIRYLRGKLLEMVFRWLEKEKLK